MCIKFSKIADEKLKNCKTGCFILWSCWWQVTQSFGPNKLTPGLVHMVINDLLSSLPNIHACMSEEAVVVEWRVWLAL